MTDSLSLPRLKFLKQLGIMYSGTFIPFSQSRNKGKKKLTDRSLNWKLNISRGGHKMKVDYQQGIAFCPSYAQGAMSVATAEALEFEAENGRHAGKRGEIEIPPLEDVLYSLIQDSSVLDHPNFDAWAIDYGYDPDSKSAEKIYNACRENALMLRIVLGEDNIKILQELFQDY